MPSRAEGVKGLLHFVKDNARGLFEIPDAEVAEHILKLLVDEGMEPQRLLTRALNSQHPVRLVGYLGQRIEDQAARNGILEKLAKFQTERKREHHFGHIDLGGCISRFMRKTQDIVFMVANFRDVLLDEDLKLGQTVVDLYWIQRFEPRLEYKDGLIGAWLQLKKANLGIAEPEESIKPGEEREQDRRAYPASDDAIGKMLRALYSQLVQQEEINPQDLPSYMTVGREAAQNLPGFQLAKRYLADAAARNRLTFKHEGAMALNLAAHFNKKKLAKERAKRRSAPPPFRAPAPPGAKGGKAR